MNESTSTIFYLYNTRVFDDFPLLRSARGIDRPDLLRQAIREQPEHTSSKARTWRIADMASIDDTGLYFRIGRDKHSSTQVYFDGGFREETLTTNPWTHVVIDLRTGTTGIAREPTLANTTDVVAAQLEKLLNSTTITRAQGVQIDINAITDPRSFLEYLAKAERITAFGVTVKRPNTIDANKDVIKPLERFIRNIHAKKGRLGATGNSLSATEIQDVVRSAAASGDEADATIIDGDGAKIRRRLGDNPATFTIAEAITQDQYGPLIRRMRQYRESIRGSQGE